jgi:hypothetical protein
MCSGAGDDLQSCILGMHGQRSPLSGKDSPPSAELLYLGAESLIASRYPVVTQLGKQD